MLVIDIHEHAIPRRGFMDPNMRGETVTTASELVAFMDRDGIDKMCVLPLSSPETFAFVQSNEEAFAACDQYPDRFIKFCHVDPRLERNCLDYDFTPILEYYKSQGAKALGELTCNLWWDDARVRNLLRDCETAGLPVTFHITTHEFNTYGLITERRLLGLERTLQRFPDLQLLGHSAAFWSEVGPVPEAERNGYPTGKVEDGGALPELMRKCGNLWGDLSAGSGFNAIRRDPEWGYAFIEEFQDRLLMGLDLCNPGNFERDHLTGYLRAAVEDGKISRQAFEKLMGLNAVKLLKLEE